MPCFVATGSTGFIDGLSADLAIDDQVKVRVKDSVVAHVVTNFRLRGSFSGKGFWEFKLRGADGIDRIGLAERN